ncbi:MAG: hypothetical protein HQL59_07800 [Magnetococcales bacterium]|nr:hypothetical protein [Magnetococcales bacterium]
MASERADRDEDQGSVARDGHAVVPRGFWEAFVRASRKAVSLSRVVGDDKGVTLLRDLLAVSVKSIEERVGRRPGR